MSETIPEAPAGHKGFDAGFLKNKIGPLPLWVWLVAAIAIYWYVSRSGGILGGSTSGTTAADAGVDPVTGEPYSQELGAAEQQLSDAQAGQTGAAGGYADDNAWARAALDYLVGTGVDPTQANEALQQFLAGQTLTSQQQADVNLAIQGIGPPPDLPGPVGSPPPNLGGGGGGGGGTGGPGKPTKAPTGLRSAVISDTGAKLSWGKVTGATEYRVRVWNGKTVVSDRTVAGTNDAAAGLRPAHKYSWQVAAKNSGGQGPFSAMGSFTTKRAGTNRPPTKR